MDPRDEDIRVRTRDDGYVVMGAMSNEGINTLTDIAGSEAFREMEQQGRVEIRRLPAGGVYLIIAEPNTLEVETYGEDEEELH